MGAMRGYCLRAPGADTRDDVERDWAQQLSTARNTRLRANHGTSPAEEKLRDELEDSQMRELYLDLEQCRV